MADCQAHLSRVMATAPSSSCCKRTGIYEIIIKIPKKTYILPHPSSPFAFLIVHLHYGPKDVWVCRRTRIVVVVSPIVVDPQLPPLLHLLHLEVLVVAALVLTRALML